MNSVYVQFLIAMASGSIAWLLPRWIAHSKLQPGGIFLQSGGYGAWIELIWVLLLCSAPTWLCHLLAKAETGRLKRVCFLVAVPLMVTICYNSALRNRYCIAYVTAEGITLDGSPRLKSVTLRFSSVEKAVVVNRGAGEESEMEIHGKAGKVYRLCTVFGYDKHRLESFRTLVSSLSTSGMKMETIDYR